MPVHYYLRKNKLTENEDDYMASVSSSNQNGLDQVIQLMIQQGSTVTEADILSVISDFQKAVQLLLGQGGTVTTPFAIFRSTIRGVFTGPDDSFDPSRHNLSVRVRPGLGIRDYYKTEVPTQKHSKPVSIPQPDLYIDANSGEHNGLVTPGGMGTIKGTLLSFDPEDEAQGIFFIKEDGTEIKVEVVGQNQTSVLRFIIPTNLNAGEYYIEIRNKPGKKLRKGQMEDSLTVAA